MPASFGHRLTAKKKSLFLEALKKTGNISTAANEAGISRSSLYDKKGKDADFALAWEAAREIGFETLEDEAQRRAVEGVEEPVYTQRGDLAGHVRKYSDTLLIVLLKGHKPEKYRELRGIALTGAKGGPLEVADVTELLINRVNSVAARRETPGSPGKPE